MSWTTLTLTILGIGIGFTFGHAVGAKQGWELATEYYRKHIHPAYSPQKKLERKG